MPVVPPLVRKHGLQRFVEYVPRLSTEELRRRHNSAQIVVSPAPDEGAGLPAPGAPGAGRGPGQVDADSLPP